MSVAMTAGCRGTYPACVMELVMARTAQNRVPLIDLNEHAGLLAAAASAARWPQPGPAQHISAGPPGAAGVGNASR